MSDIFCRRKEHAANDAVRVDQKFHSVYLQYVLYDVDLSHITLCCDAVLPAMHRRLPQRA